jgi:hypothetical protein
VHLIYLCCKYCTYEFLLKHLVPISGVVLLLNVNVNIKSGPSQTLFYSISWNYKNKRSTTSLKMQGDLYPHKVYLKKVKQYFRSNHLSPEKRIKNLMH